MAAPRAMGDSMRSSPPFWSRSCCSDTETVFRVRSGPDYKRNGLKDPSGPTFYDCIGIDVFKCATKVEMKKFAFLIRSNHIFANISNFRIWRTESAVLLEAFPHIL